MLPTESDLHDARVIVERVLGASVEAAEPRSPMEGHDFDLSEGGRPTGAMVVARSVCPPQPQFRGAKRRLVWVAVGQRCWVIRLEAVSRAGLDGHMIVGLLAELEAAGGTAFQRADQVRVAALRAAGVRLSPAERVLEDMVAFGVVGAESRLGPPDPPTVVATEPSPAIALAEAINEAAEDEVWAPATRARFPCADAGDHHLFVWLDSAGIAADATMGPDVVPPPPLLAPETTTLWVAVADRVWQTNGVGEWEALGPICQPRLLVPASLR